jgi:membrane-associated phospholipid phosphatase
MKQLQLGGLIASGTTFVILAYFAHRLPYFPQDLNISQGMQQFNGLLPAFMYGVSIMSSFIPATIIVALVTVCLGKSNRRLEAIILGSAAAVTALALVPAIKSWVGRPRPAPDLVLVMATDSGESFPSGHATFVMVFYAFIIYLLPKLIHNQAAVKTIRGLLIAFIGLTFTSRIYLGLHWASDVLGGFFLGWLVLSVMISIYYYYPLKFPRRR